jgi:transketolase
MPSRTERANAIRALAMDAVQQANSGHPGAPMGLADVGEVFWREVLKHNPNNPAWFDRDRFVLSNGHASMFLYAMLHLSGYAVSIDDIRHFRQLHSKTAGHPEYHECPGVETTTGPLGQGLANAVGFALAERELARTFNRPGYEVINHRTWVVAGDGCLMEGISHEAGSFAGTQGLSKLICIYDDNGISIDGETKGWFTEDVGARFESYGWHVDPSRRRPRSGRDRRRAGRKRRKQDKPTLIRCRTVIGFGSPNKQGTAEAHGAALGPDEVSLARRSLNWSYGPFEVPEAIYKEWDCRAAGAKREESWNALMGRYREAFPDLARELDRRIAGELPKGWSDALDGVARARPRARPKISKRASRRSAASTRSRRRCRN